MDLSASLLALATNNNNHQSFGWRYQINPSRCANRQRLLSYISPNCSSLLFGRKSPIKARESGIQFSPIHANVAIKLAMIAIYFIYLSLALALVLLCSMHWVAFSSSALQTNTSIVATIWLQFCIMAIYRGSFYDNFLSLFIIVKIDKI